MKNFWLDRIKQKQEKTREEMPHFKRLWSKIFGTKGKRKSKKIED